MPMMAPPRDIPIPRRARQGAGVLEEQISDEGRLAIGQQDRREEA
jgi:hypothetical protein